MPYTTILTWGGPYGHPKVTTAEEWYLALEAAQIRVWDLDVRTQTMTWPENLGPGFRLVPSASSSTYDAFLALVHPEDRDYVTRTVAHVLEEGASYEIEYRLIQPNGSIVWRLTKGQVVRDAIGQAVRLVGIDMDITTRKQAEQALALAYAELQQRVEERTVALRHEMTERQRAEAECRRLEHEAQQAAHFALLGRLAAGVSHEIRNPLGAVFLHVDLLEEALQQPTPDSPAEIAQSLTEIKTQLARLQELVQDYLSLVRMGSIQRTPQDLGVAVQSWATEMQESATTRGVRVHLEGLAGLGQVAFHPSTLRRAMLNLVQNALDAMPQGGAVTLAGQTTATHVHLQVRDTGVGIPTERLAQIFEQLYTTKPGGTGLGLYIVQEIVATHEGQVTVQSTEGRGTTFTITLPRTPGEARSQPPAGSQV
jgi:signal transduction histidine kinase